MKKIITMCMVLLLVGVLLTGVTAAALAAEGDELPTVTAPPATEAPEEPILTAMPDKPMTPEDADATDTPENTGPADDADPDTGGISGYEVATVPVLVIICLGLGQCVKPTKLDNKWIPALMIPTGAVLGFLAFHVMPDFPANDRITAIGIGVSSGLAATGIHQVYKQLRN